MTKIYPLTKAAAAFALAALTTVAANAQSSGGFNLLTMGHPPVIGEQPMVVDVLPDVGACFVHPLLDRQPCHRVRLPNGETMDSFIDGYTEAGPARLLVLRLTYDWTQSTASHPVVPDFALVEHLE